MNRRALDVNRAAAKPVVALESAAGHDAVAEESDGAAESSASLQSRKFSIHSFVRDCLTIEYPVHI